MKTPVYDPRDTLEGYLKAVITSLVSRLKVQNSEDQALIMLAKEALRKNASSH